MRPCALNQLPVEVLRDVLRHLQLEDFCAAADASRALRDAADHSAWQASVRLTRRLWWAFFSSAKRLPVVQRSMLPEIVSKLLEPGEPESAAYP